MVAAPLSNKDTPVLGTDPKNNNKNPIFGKMGGSDWKQGVGLQWVNAGMQDPKSRKRDLLPLLCPRDTQPEAWRWMIIVALRRRAWKRKVFSSALFQIWWDMRKLPFSNYLKVNGSVCQTGLGLEDPWHIRKVIYPSEFGESIFLWLCFSSFCLVFDIHNFLVFFVKGQGHKYVSSPLFQCHVGQHTCSQVYPLGGCSEALFSLPRCLSSFSALPWYQLTPQLMKCPNILVFAHSETSSLHFPATWTHLTSLGSLLLHVLLSPAHPCIPPAHSGNEMEITAPNCTQTSD